MRVLRAERVDDLHTPVKGQYDLEIDLGGEVIRFHRARLVTGPWLSWPAERHADGSWAPFVYVSAELATEIRDAMIAALPEGGAR